MSLVLLGVLTVLVGFLIGLSGMGGILLIPALAALAGLSTQVSMATALFTFLFTGILSTWLYQRHGSIHWPTTLPLCAGALIFGYLGALTNADAPVGLLNILLGGVIVFAGVYPLLPGGVRALPRTGGASRGLLALIGAVVGFGAGLTGIGGPVLSIPIMISCGFPPLASIAAGQVLQIAAALSGSLGNLANGTIDFGIAWWVIALELAGVAAGVRLAHNAPVSLLKNIVSAVCILVGGFILLRALLV